MNHQIQIARFPDGGFVLHKVTFVSENGRFSAWYSADGALLDAEQLLETRGVTACMTYNSRAVKKDGPIWRMLRTVGQRYVVATATAQR